VLQIIFCQSSTNFFIHGQQQQLHHDHQQQLHPSPIKNFFIHHPSTNFFIHDHQQTFSSITHQQTFSFMIINNNFIHHPSTNFFIHDHQQQLHPSPINKLFHSPLPDTMLLTGRTHCVVNTFIIGQLIRTMLISLRPIPDTSRRVVNYRTFIIR